MLSETHVVLVRLDLLHSAEMVGAGASMATHNNCIYVFGGMDEDRAEHMYMWKWDLSSDMGFEPVIPRYAKRCNS